MRIVVVLVLAFAAAGCTEPPRALPPKRPNTELIIGEFERRPPETATAIRFTGDGSFRIAKSRAELDRSPHLADGKWQLDGDQLTLTSERGMCAEPDGERTGVYKVVISRIGIRFAKQTDSCERRSRFDGQTWWRIK